MVRHKLIAFVAAFLFGCSLFDFDEDVKSDITFEDLGIPPHMLIITYDGYKTTQIRQYIIAKGGIVYKFLYNLNTFLIEIPGDVDREDLIANIHTVDPDGLVNIETDSIDVKLQIHSEYSKKRKSLRTTRIEHGWGIIDATKLLDLKGDGE